MKIAKRTTCVALCGAVFSCLAILASAQVTMDLVLPGNNSQGFHGTSVSVAGDMNGDGFPEFIAGAPYHFPPNGGPGIGSLGRARVYSGIDGSVLYNVLGNSPLSLTGWAVSGAGDVDGDGFPDFVVGSPEFDLQTFPAGPGAVHIYSGQNGSLIRTITGTQLASGFGYSVASLGDVNGDGHDDTAIGAPLDFHLNEFPGSVTIYSGVDGQALWTAHGTEEGEQFGFDIENAGDVNCDGVNDVIVGAWAATTSAAQAGRIQVLSGIDGSVLYTKSGATVFQSLGFQVSGAGDVDQDGNHDFMAVSAGLGEVSVYSGADGNILYTLNQNPVPPNLARSVSAAGDVNGDGYDDMLLGFPLSNSPLAQNTGKVVVYSGKDGTPLRTVFGSQSFSFFGAAISGGDINNDDFPDLLVGAPDQNGGSGAAHLALSPQLPTLSYQPDSKSTRLQLDWIPDNGNPQSTTGFFHSFGASPNATGQYVVSLAEADLRIFGFPLLVAVDAGLNLIENGSITFDLMGQFNSGPISRVHPAIAGSHVCVQYFEESPIPSSSNGVRLLIQ